MIKPIVVSKARLHNLKGFDLKIPKDKLVVITGISGSGKSSLAFDLLFETGRRQYLQAIGVLAAFGDSDGFDKISGLSPTVAVKQGIIYHSNPRSVVGTQTRLLHHLEQLYANEFNQRHPNEQTVKGASFSFNSPLGMCLECQGRGHVLTINPSELLSSKATTLQGMYTDAKVATSAVRMSKKVKTLFGVDVNKPFQQLPKAVQNYVLYGQNPGGKPTFGLENHLGWRFRKGLDVGNAIIASACPACDGFRIRDEAREVRIRRKHIGELAVMTISQLSGFIDQVADDCKKRSSEAASSLNRVLLKHCKVIVEQLIAVKLDYLSLYRPIPTLSGGESQRLFLMSYLTGELDSLSYIFDEPTAGLHESEKQSLIDRLQQLKKQGNAVIIVEHDARCIEAAEHIIDMGPLAGVQGGEVVYQGSYKGLLRTKGSITGQYLSGKKALPEKLSYAKVNASTPMLTLAGVATNNLKNVTLTVPLGMLVGIAGVSGSGKSSLISDTLVHALQQQLKSSQYHRANAPLHQFANAQPVFKKLEGSENISRCIEVAQEPIGRRSNSNPATYLGIWDRVRKIFAACPHAKKRKLTEGHFSFNAKGACETCKGNGHNRMWLGNSFVTYACSDCKGQRYMNNILSVKFQGFNISDVLEMSCDQAVSVFAHDKPIMRMLDVVVRTGMGYIKLGQPTSTLSGGEAQRLKLAREIGKHRSTKSTLYVLDEPTTGLSLFDATKMLILLGELIEQGNSVVVIEHDPKVLSCCDWIIETGPGAGHLGGNIIGKGSPKQLSQSTKSIIGRYLIPAGGNVK